MIWNWKVIASIIGIKVFIVFFLIDLLNKNMCCNILAFFYHLVLEDLFFKHKTFFIEAVIKRVFVFPGLQPFAWPPALLPNLYLPALAPNLYLPALAPNLYLPALAPNLHLPGLPPNLYLPALTSNLCLPQICLYRLNPAWVYIYRPCLPNLYLLALAYDLYAHRLHTKLIYPQWCWIM